MKNSTSLASKLLILGSATALSLTSAHAANAIWKGNSGSLDTGTNWTGGTGAAGIPATTQTAQFSTNTTAIAPTFAHGTTTTWAGISVSQTGNLTMESNSGATATLDLGTANTSSTLISVASGAGAVTIGDATDDVNIVAAATNTAITDTISNSSSSNLTIQNNLTTSGTGVTTLEVGGTGTTVFNGVLSNSSNAARLGLTVDAGTTVTLANTNTFTGPTVVNGKLNATAAGAVAGAVTVNTGGTLVFGSTVANTVTGNVTLNGGTIQMNGASETIGTLTLTAGSTDIINVTAGGTLVLDNVTFGAGAHLEIIGWSGSTTTGSTTTQVQLGLINGHDAAPVFEANANSISWSQATVAGTDITSFDSTGVATVDEITYAYPAVPEPSTIFVGLGLLVLLAWGGRQQLLEAGRKLMLVRV